MNWPTTDAPISEPILVLLGPTAVGKTALSLALAERFSCEIVGLDSMQIYRHMDIGTAKATAEERARVPHHLLDVVAPDEEYHVARYVADATRACREIIVRGNRPLLVGGTGLYLKGLLEGLFELPAVPEAVRGSLRKRLAEEGRAALFAELSQCDPESARRIHPNDTHRLLRALEIFQATGRPWSEHLREQQVRPFLSKVLQLGLISERDALYERINLRVDQMLGFGLLAEVEKLLALGYDPSLKAMQSIGYRHMLQFLQGQWDWDETRFLLARDTRRYAKRQMTWFGNDSNIRWFAPSDTAAIFACVEAFLAGAKRE
ncbi:MAG: tRNA (adenosine(37)-N6)-dimethylallyltransferase MiaA [Deltaproteobacteria bacterium RIFOXYD12_FULL_55_16]|nr:MAG: tRNA (adenosine(37)-N6)-dimethylallyltransferase MiaA [Deltaproteobacteria bacterium RIFOXYD12_FULL_55_16]